VVVLYFGIGAVLGSLVTYCSLRPLTRADKEQEHARATALGLSTLGALAGGALNFGVTWLITVT
jgi:hypothetical protein